MHCLKWIWVYTQTNVQNYEHAHMKKPLLVSQSFWINNFKSSQKHYSIHSAHGKGKNSLLLILFMCLSFIHCLQFNSLKTFLHFKDSLANSEIIGLVQSRLHVRQIFFFPPTHRIKLPKACSFSLFPLLLTMCQHVHVSNNNNKSVHCEWLRSHIGLVPTSHNTMKYNQKHSKDLYCPRARYSFFVYSITCNFWVYI